MVQLAVQKGATQADVAKMLGVTRQAINAHLRGSERHGTGTKRRRTAST
jgi:DNA-binding XRE family transcriptional regulator